MSAALVNRSLSTLKTVCVSWDSNVITENFYNQVVSKLPDRYQNGSEPVDFPSAASAQPEAIRKSNEPVFNEKQSLAPQSTSSSSSSAVPPAPVTNQEYAEALYDYSPQQPEDLSLRTGDKVKVLERLSPDWWRGENNGRVGMFPSNYVKIIPNNDRQAPPSYSRPQGMPANMSPSISSPQQQQFYQPPQQQQQQYYQPPPQQQYYQPPPQQQMTQYQSPQQQQQPQVAVVQQQPQQQQQHSSTNEGLKKFGSKLGNAAIFGAGATLGSDLVNSIF
ncbi:hypothetical protein WICPIJ_004456 [Wickerhamomyces pijperi]|uniref:SH3 domain-containing protein n=1 Tax=Wickerhamomyces pijperi TaxID=599730 RepID=A0A9P8Q5U0_WICPI|nr:hypothetical protein WICPIJ_004456 [Wickerhamomyces pijperi]